MIIIVKKKNFKKVIKKKVIKKVAKKVVKKAVKKKAVARKRLPINIWYASIIVISSEAAVKPPVYNPTDTGSCLKNNKMNNTAGIAIRTM